MKTEITESMANYLTRLAQESQAAQNRAQEMQQRVYDAFQAVAPGISSPSSLRREGERWILTDEVEGAPRIDQPVAEERGENPSERTDRSST